ncbi:MAG: hypothetical protein RQ753_04730, partial [Desulfurivibrionaceae bacterium]|nr:hypothetical protein [Desulfurivibrionaceae bacterium]
MRPDLSGKIARQLREGGSRSRIWRELKDSENREELRFLLNDLPTAERQRVFYPATLLLAALLLIMTGIKVFDAIAIGTPNLYFFLALIVPIINIYVLKKILRFRRTG